MQSDNKIITNKLEKEYGKLSIRLIKQDQAREIYTVDQKNRVLAYALTFFRNTQDQKVRDAHAEIKNGGMIGKTFYKRGLKPKRKILWRGKIKLPKWLKAAFQTDEHLARAQFLEFWVQSQKNKKQLYAVILEIYKPGIALDLSDDINFKDKDVLEINERAYLQDKGLEFVR